MIIKLTIVGFVALYVLVIFICILWDKFTQDRNPRKASLNDLIAWELHNRVARGIGPEFDDTLVYGELRQAARCYMEESDREGLPPRTAEEAGWPAAVGPWNPPAVDGVINETGTRIMYARALMLRDAEMQRLERLAQQPLEGTTCPALTTKDTGST